MRCCVALLSLVILTTSVACGEPSAGGGSGADARSAATGRSATEGEVTLTEADAGQVLQVTQFIPDIGRLDKKGIEIHLSGDDGSTLRWRFAQKPDPFVMEWHAVDGRPPFETDGLLGDPTTAAKVVELRGNVVATATATFELVEQDPSSRVEAPARRLEYTFDIRYRAPTHGGSEPPCPHCMPG